MKAISFDRKFDLGKEEVIDDLDMTTATRPNKRLNRVEVDFPVWMVELLDREARRITPIRQAVIKAWLSEKLGVVAKD